MNPKIEFLLILAGIFFVFLMLLWWVARQKEDESVYLESFLNTCATTKKNYHIACTELEMLRYKIKESELLRFEKMIIEKFGEGL